MAALAAAALADVVRAHDRGEPRALAGVCSAHPFVIDAALALAASHDVPVLVESTSNQVNQDGGYTGRTPAAHAAFVRGRAAAAGIAPERVILGGDHLGPHPYRALPARAAMAAGCELVRRCAAAGYGKLHLDATMALGDDPPGPLSEELVTERTAQLCAAAEQARAELPPEAPAPLYVIGTDVPVPGGEATETAPPAVTPAAAAERALSLARRLFRARGLEDAWDRVAALVVQPGIDFTATRVFDYDRRAASSLAAFARGTPGLVLEAHSTDYQAPAALAALVEDGFGVLKVGPWLTFAFRQAALGLAAVEREWLRDRRGLALSNLRDALVQAMDADPRHWRGHHDPSAPEPLRLLGYSDRVRYYWNAPGVRDALARLVSNLSHDPPPLPLLAQHLPAQHDAVRSGAIATGPEDLLRHAVQEVLRVYAAASSGIQAGAPSPCG